MKLAEKLVNVLDEAKGTKTYYYLVAPGEGIIFGDFDREVVSQEKEDVAGEYKKMKIVKGTEGGWEKVNKQFQESMDEMKESGFSSIEDFNSKAKVKGKVKGAHVDMSAKNADGIITLLKGEGYKRTWKDKKPSGAFASKSRPDEEWTSGDKSNTLFLSFPENEDAFVVVYKKK